MGSVGGGTVTRIALPEARRCRYGAGMALAILLSALAMTLIVGVRYLLASGGFALASR